MCVGGTDPQNIDKERMKKDSERMDAINRTTNLDASLGSYGFLCLGLSSHREGDPTKISHLDREAVCLLPSFSSQP